MKAGKKILVIALAVLCVALLISTTVVIGQKGEKELDRKKAADMALGLSYFQIAENANARLTPEEKETLRAAIASELERGRALVGHDEAVPNEAGLQKREIREQIRAIARTIKARAEETLGKQRVQELQILKPVERVLEEPHSCWYAYYSYLYSYWTYYYAYWTYVYYDTSLAYYTLVYSYYSYVYAYYAYLNLC